MITDKTDEVNDFNINFKHNVRIVDAMMGSYKTTNMFKYMAANPENKYLYVSIFLQEVGCGEQNIKGRIQETLPQLDFITLGGEGSKLSQIKKKVSEGRNIAATHSLFYMFDQELVDMLIVQSYVLVVDETIDAIQRFKELNRDDVRGLLSSDMVSVEDETNVLVWNEKAYPDYSSKKGKFNTVRNYCTTRSLILHKGNLLVLEYPPTLLKGLKQVFIITFLFEGSIMACWLRKNNIPYEYISHKDFKLKDARLLKQTARENLEIINMHTLKRLRNKDPKTNMFTMTWYKTQMDKIKCLETKNDTLIKMGLEPEVLKECLLQDTTTTIESFINKHKKKGELLFWTTYSEYKNTLAGKGFSRTPKGGLNPFLPWSSKSINAYQDHTICVYGVNPHKSNTEITFLDDRGITFDRDLYSLSEAIQFIWRGSIRKGSPMKLFVLSERIEKLLMDWLKED